MSRFNSLRIDRIKEVRLQFFILGERIKNSVQSYSFSASRLSHDMDTFFPELIGSA